MDNSFEAEKPLAPDHFRADPDVGSQRFLEMGVEAGGGGTGEGEGADWCWCWCGGQAGRCQRGLGDFVFHSTIDHWLRWAARIREMSGLTATGLPTPESIGRSEWLSA